MYSLFGGYTNELQRLNIYKRIQGLCERNEDIAQAHVYEFSDATQIGGYVVIEDIDVDVDTLDRLGVFDKFDIHHAVYDWRRGQDRIELVTNVREISLANY
jgi:hypothetical protein